MAHRGIAQLVEYWSPKPWVVGSSPSAPAKKIPRTSFSEFFIQSEGLVCNQRATRVVCNPSLCDGMASRASVHLTFGLMPYITP